MHPLSVILIRGVELCHFARILEQFPATRIGDTSEAHTWLEATLALKDVATKAACCIGQWLVLLDPEARLPEEANVLGRIALRYETTVIGLISSREPDLHKLEYHSKERRRSFLWRYGQPLEETGTPLFQETELAPIAWDYANMTKLMARLAVSPSLLRSSGPFVLKKLFVEPTPDGSCRDYRPGFSFEDEGETEEGL